MVGLTAPIIGVLTFVFLAGSLSVAALIAGFAITLGFAGLLTIPFRWYCESLVRGRTRRLLIEQLGGEGPYPCSVELRPEGVLVEQIPVDLKFPWREALGVNDTPEGIETTSVAGRCWLVTAASLRKRSAQRFLSGYANCFRRTLIAPPRVRSNQAMERTCTQPSCFLRTSVDAGRSSPGR